MDSPRVNLIKGITFGTLIGFLFAFGGYLLVCGDRTQFGWVMFFLVPVVSGFAIAITVRQGKRRIIACCFCAALLSLGVLLTAKLEGIICIVMASPLIGGGMAIGAALGYVVRGKSIDKMSHPAKTTIVLLLLCPLFIAAADRVERPYRAAQLKETFSTETVVMATPEKTWDLVARMQKLDGPQPFLLRAGLPLPTRCELDNAAVGGHRVCYFNSGLIAQEVTDWRRPSFMGLRVTESTLPGRHWLTFIDASYELFPEGTQTRIVRHTTIGTRLYPRWYWRPLERWGVTSEHDYVFQTCRDGRNPLEPMQTDKPATILQRQLSSGERAEGEK